MRTLLADRDIPKIRAVFRTEAKATPLRSAHGSHSKLEIVVGVDAADPASVLLALKDCTVAFLVTPFSHVNGISGAQNWWAT